MDTRHIGPHHTRAGAAVGAALALMLSGAAAHAMGKPRVFKQVKAPRSGRALGKRVAVVYSKHYQVSVAGLEKLHPFDIRKYAKIYLKLNTDGLIRPADVFVPDAARAEDILRVHTRAYLARLKQPAMAARYLEAPAVANLPAPLLDACVLSPFRYATGGTILAARLALKHGIAINIGGGYHHAEPNKGGGFCIYADMPIAVRVLQAEKAIRRALIVDLDVHQGNGTAVCLAGDDDVFTFSMHQGSIYPIPKATSDLDVELDAGTDDKAYLRLLRRHLPGVIDKAKPDLVFLQAGCDTLAEDPLAALAMTRSGIVDRDAVVVDECVRRGLPVVIVLGGGYSKQAWAVQYASIRRTIATYGLVNGPPHPRRDPSLKEKLYTK